MQSKINAIHLNMEIVVDSIVDTQLLYAQRPICDRLFSFKHAALNLKASLCSQCYLLKTAMRNKRKKNC